MFTIVPDMIYYIFIVLISNFMYTYLYQINIANDNHKINIKQIIIIRTLFSDTMLPPIYI